MITRLINLLKSLYSKLSPREVDINELQARFEDEDEMQQAWKDKS